MTTTTIPNNKNLCKKKYATREKSGKYLLNFTNREQVFSFIEIIRDWSVIDFFNKIDYIAFTIINRDMLFEYYSYIFYKI